MTQKRMKLIIVCFCFLMLSSAYVQATLNNLGVVQNTLVVFIPDNGVLNNNTSNHPLLVGESYAFKAAMRGPFIVMWPAVVKPKHVSKVRVIGTDFYPTFSEVAGIHSKLEQHLDGHSLLPVLNGKSSKNRCRLIFHYPHYTGSTSPFSSIIEGDYKLIHFYNDEAGAYLLFDL